MRAARLVFLYGQVLHMEVRPVGEIERAKRPERLPVVLTRGEVARVLDGMTGTSQLHPRNGQAWPWRPKPLGWLTRTRASGIPRSALRLGASKRKRRRHSTRERPEIDA